MRRLAASALAGCVCAAFIAAVSPAQTPISPIGSRSLVVSLSSNRAGARPVSVTLTFSYMMQCGYPGPGPVRITLPAAERVPSALARGAVLVDGAAARSVALLGRTVTVGLSPRPRVICDVIGEGRLSIELIAAGGFGNPPHAGTYTVSAATSSPSGGAFSARFRVQPA